VFSALFSVVLAISVPSVVSIWYTIGTCIIPGLLVPVLASYFERLKIPAVYAFGAMVNGWFISTASLISGHICAHNGIPAYCMVSNQCILDYFCALLWGLGKLEKQPTSKQ